jgi:hypothetical protein
MKVRILILAIAAFAIVAPEANAGPHIGHYSPARVTCDSMSHQLTIVAKVGAGDQHETQRVAYRLKLWRYERRNGVDQWFPYTQAWRVLTHQRVQWYWDENLFTWMQTSTPFVEDETTRNVAIGYWYVHIQYAWEIGNQWYDRNLNLLGNGDSAPWEVTTGYLWPGLHGFHQHCIA